VAGVLDITTTELADELVGGILTAGPDRLTAAAKHGVPQVVSVGALDMVNFGPRDTVPQKFADRKFHIHNPTVTLMRTTLAENAKLGEEIGRKVSASKGPAAILLPLRGVSAIDRTGQPFDDPAARTALFDSIRAHHGEIELVELDAHINDESFAAIAAHKLLSLLKEHKLLSPASGERKLPESASRRAKSLASAKHIQGADAPRSPNFTLHYTDCDRFWFLTWTTYGTWLPGDKRGFVSNVADEQSGEMVIHNIPGTPYDEDDAQLRERSIQNLKCEPIYLVRHQAEAMLEQFQETAQHRNWLLIAAAIMCNHAHLVVGVQGDPAPADVLRDFKSYASRRLNESWPKPVSGTWWTESGSKRKLPCDDAVVAAVHYVRNQPNPLVVWVHPNFH
jgi:REP element-mobilizing transposase RayT